MELQRLQRRIQRAPDQIRDPSRQLPSRDPSGILEQLRDRIQAIALDMSALNQSCNVDASQTRRLPTSPNVSPANADKAPAPKRRRRSQRRKRRSDKRPCSSTIEESSSSEANTVLQGTHTTILPHTHPDFLHLPFPRQLLSSHGAPRADVKHERGQLSLARVLLNTQGRGRYGGIRVGEAEKPGPATHARDWTVTEQPNVTHRRINEAGDSVPSSQDSVTSVVQNLRISFPAAPAALPAPPPQTMRNIRRPPKPKHMPREYLRCAQCGPDPAAYKASTDGGLMQHMEQKHGGQLLLPESVVLLRRLDRAACVACGTMRSQPLRELRVCHSHSTSTDGGLMQHMGQKVWDNCVGSIARLVCAVALSDRSVVAGATPVRATGDTFQDRRQLDAAASGPATGQQLPQRLAGEPLDDSPLPNCPIRNVVLTDRDKQLLSELRRALPRCVVSRCATAWAESLEGAMSGHQSWALLCRFRCSLLLAEIPKGVDRNSELKQRLQLWESGQISDSDLQGPEVSKILGRFAEQQEGAATDRRTARETSVRLDSPRIHQQSHEGMVLRRAQRTVAGTGLQHSSRGARALELVPPVRSVPMRPESPWVEGATNWHGAR